MKKILLTLLALFLTISLTACGNDEKEEKEKTNNEGSSEVEKGNNKEENSSNSETESELEKIELYSDDTKMVFKNGGVQAVYYYEGEKITGYHAYTDYGSLEAANYALSLLKEENNEAIDKAYIKGKYLVIEYAKSEYENLKTSDIRTLYSYLEQVQEKN